MKTILYMRATAHWGVDKYPNWTCGARNLNAITISTPSTRNRLPLSPHSIASPATAQAVSTAGPAATCRIRNLPIRIKSVMHYVLSQLVDSGTPSSDASLDACRVNGHSNAIAPPASLRFSPASARRFADASGRTAGAFTRRQVVNTPDLKRRMSNFPIPVIRCLAYIPGGQFPPLT